jgi:long-chain acyl-CoA synthetase
METDEYRGVIESMGRVAPRVDTRIINPRTHFEIDLGLDSLHRIELLSAMERKFGITIPDEVFDKMETITDLVSLVKEQKAENRPTSVERVLDLKNRILSQSLYRSPRPAGRNTVPGLRFLRNIAAAVKGIRAEFAEPLSARDAPYLFVSLHSNPLDAFWILQALPEKVAETTFFMSEDIKYPWFPYVFYASNMVENNKINDPIETIKLSLAVIRSKKSLISFPEGRPGSAVSAASAVTGRSVEFKSGVGIVARETNAAIVPVKNTGATISFGKPFSFANIVARHELAHDASPREFSEYIRTRIFEL